MLKKAVNKLLLIPLYRFKLKKKNVILMKNVKISTKTTFEGYSKIHKNVNIKDSFIGLGTYIGWNSILFNCKIGRFCSIAPKVEVIYGRHPINNFISTHPSFFSLKKQAGFTFTNEQLYVEHKLVDDKFSVIIGNDVWIGYGASILEGVTIGDGAIVGARSLVTKDLEPYSINVGIPAKKIGYRFEKEIINKLLENKWWEKDFDWIKTNYNKLNSIYNIDF